MEQLNLEKCESLADVFFAVIGGKTDNIREIEAYMAKSPLKYLLHATDVERVVKYDGFFSEEVVDAVYALLPVKLQIAPNRMWIMTPQAFRKLNAAQMSKPASRFLSIPISLAFTVYMLNFENKIKKVVNAIKGIEDPKEEKLKPKIPFKTVEDVEEEKRHKKRLYEQNRRRKELLKITKKRANPPQTKDDKKNILSQPKKLPVPETKAPILSPEKTSSKPVKSDVSEEKTIPVKTSSNSAKKQPNKKKIVKSSKNRKFIMPKTDERYPKWAKIVARLRQIKKLCALKKTSEAEKEKLKKEANCLKSAKYRLENPDAWKKSYKKMSELPPEKQAERRAGNNRRNDTFRSIHREELRVYHNKRRAQEKAENPEAVKEKDKKHNSSDEAKAAKKRYYEKNTQQVIEKAVRHNKIKRFKQKTGPVILGLLQGIINNKIK